MAINEEQAQDAADRLKENLEKVDTLSKRMIAAFTKRNPANLTLNAPGPDVALKASEAYWKQLSQNPAKLFETQMEYWSDSVKKFAEAQALMMSTATSALADKDDAGQPPAPVSDKRFQHPSWETNPYFKLLKDQYALSAATVEKMLEAADDLEPKERRRLRYFTQQIVDMMAPSNFLATNPEALERAIETDGESLVKGMENLVADLEANNGEMVVRLADESAFELGRNIATTPGKIVYRNQIMELLQFEPVTEQVYATPVVIYPPWINKYYILDLKAQNSMIRWLTEQGYTVFVVSWINPDRSHAEIGMEDYIEHGFLQAMTEVKAITGEKQINAVGYCIAGTTLSLTLALMKARGDKSVRSATFFTALTDFSDQGEFTPFLQDDFIDGIEEEVEEQGILRSFIMARTFSFLRSRDLIYTPAVRSYMMGEAPPAFDLLYWNGDGANLPGKMTMQYLRGLCQRNEFAEGGFELFGETLQLKDVDVPLMSIACETDHIAAWKDCYRGVQQMGSRSKEFVVAQSGHIAGIVNPPVKEKYGYYLNDNMKLDTENWLETAEHHKGSWWPHWESWLKRRSGRKVDARTPGDKKHPILGEAPGPYVAKKATDL